MYMYAFLDSIPYIYIREADNIWIVTEEIFMIYMYMDMIMKDEYLRYEMWAFLMHIHYTSSTRQDHNM